MRRTSSSGVDKGYTIGGRGFFCQVMRVVRWEDGVEEGEERGRWRSAFMMCQGRANN